MKVIEVKKFDNQKDALEMQKSIQGKYILRRLGKR